MKRGVIFFVLLCLVTAVSASPLNTTYVNASNNPDDQLYIIYNELQQQDDQINQMRDDVDYAVELLQQPQEDNFTLFYVIIALLVIICVLLITLVVLVTREKKTIAKPEPTLDISNPRLQHIDRYVRFYMDKNIPADSIRAGLRRQGYSDEEINQVGLI